MVKAAIPGNRNRAIGVADSSGEDRVAVRGAKNKGSKKKSMTQKAAPSKKKVRRGR